MVILDSERDWQWWIETWQYVLDACEISNQDRVLMAFSFGPFIGFWSAHDACLRRKCMVIPSGGMSTEARIELIRSAEPTVLFSTPSYAIHLGQAAREAGKDLHRSSIRCVFVAGEPGGSIPSIRQSIAELYGAVVMDHAGATEIGPWGFGSRDGTALHIIENEFIAEFLPIDQPDLHLSAGPDLQGTRELVLTSLGRFDTPVIRYRTGDIVRPMLAQSESQRESWGTNFVRLEHGVLGRADGMIVVRGVNIFPSSIEAILREFPSIGEYRLVLSKSGALDELLLEIEDRENSAEALGKRLLRQLQLRIEVRRVSEGSLPRPEGKARRVLDLR
jgi:phenylacetate-CoA ligase